MMTTGSLYVLQGEFVDLQLSWVEFEILVKPGKRLSDSWKIVSSPNEYTPA